MSNQVPAMLAGTRRKDMSVVNSKVVNIKETADNKEPTPSKGLGHRLWRLWEKAVERLAHIEDPGGPKCFLRLALRRYGGPLRLLPDGTRLVRGDLVGELHMKNEYVQALTAGGGAGTSAVLSLKAARRSLPILAALMQNDPRFREVKALIGYTMLHRGVRKIGFAVFEMSPGIRTLVALYERWLVVIYHNEGWRHVWRQRRKLIPKMVVLSRQGLMAWLDGGPSDRDSAGGRGKT